MYRTIRVRVVLEEVEEDRLRHELGFTRKSEAEFYFGLLDYKQPTMTLTNTKNAEEAFMRAQSVLEAIWDNRCAASKVSVKQPNITAAQEKALIEYYMDYHRDEIQNEFQLCIGNRWANRIADEFIRECIEAEDDNDSNVE